MSIPLTSRADGKIPPARIGGIRKALLNWYDQNKRNLPWRHTRDPYAIWVCEIMAQQTRISFLLSFYERFMARFPTLASLAGADQADVLKAWEGLGYYTRAKNLQKAAQKVVSDFGGQLPRTREELQSLPGIGEYTAGAILSIAYGIPATAVDGNVLRVFSRLEDSQADIRLPQTRQTAAEFVSVLMPEDRAGCFTQALMELGALVCVPKNPVCQDCPAAGFCEAYRQGHQHERPVASAKKAPTLLPKTVLLIRNSQGAILMRQRTEKLLSGLWVPYLMDGFADAHEIGSALKALGFTTVETTEAGSARHVFTHQIWEMRGFNCRVDEKTEPEGFRWIDKTERGKLAVPAAVRFYLTDAF